MAESSWAQCRGYYAPSRGFEYYPFAKYIAHHPSRPCCYVGLRRGNDSLVHRRLDCRHDCGYIFINLCRNSVPIHDVETRQVNWPYLTRWAQADTAQQPVLLAGQGNLEELAAHLAQLVVCEAGSACGTCPACRHFLHGSHPDVISVTLAGGEAGIKALREVLQQLNIHPTGERRAVTIHAIDAVSLPAANILLKSLEEPAVSARWILTTRYPRRLLATILSRCQRVNANPSQPPF